ncbi:hypothetical protein [Promicromonospora sp. NPDC057488]|uniref:hypothetical protein n=1 Tax=Promicromonospora sp. NPDC057488 TaxID=3346147 RepID=UPI00366FC832
MLNSVRALGTFRPWILAGLIVIASFLVSVPAKVATADECTPVTLPDGVIIPCEGEVGGGDDEGGGDPDGGGNSPRICRSQGEEIPCSSDYGSWNGRCYVRAANPQPSKDEPMWRGNDDGYILECTPYACAQAGGDLTDCPGHSFYWSPDAPAPVGPSAEELAQRAVAAMNLSMGQIGSTPPASTANQNPVGTIGLPIWLWIANRAENTTGPITRSAGGGGLTVTATGTLDRVEWTLTAANGTTVGAISCDGANAPGTPYDGRNSDEPSPTCGFGADLNGSPGNLTLTGTAYWVVQWQSSGGQTGEIPFTSQPNSSQIRIGELQALLRD